jgi:hypothetical protein
LAHTAAARSDGRRKKFTHSFEKGMIGKYMLGRTRRWEEIIMMGPRGTGCKVR